MSFDIESKCQGEHRKGPEGLKNHAVTDLIFM